MDKPRDYLRSRKEMSKGSRYVAQYHGIEISEVANAVRGHEADVIAWLAVGLGIQVSDIKQGIAAINAARHAEISATLSGEEIVMQCPVCRCSKFSADKSATKIVCSECGHKLDRSGPR